MKKQVLFCLAVLCVIFNNSNLTAQSFTDNTAGNGKTFTVPANVTSVTVAIWGGGGGGGASTSASKPGGGGGGGGAASRIFNVSPGSDISYAVGAAGTAGNPSTSGNGGAGTSSSVTYTASSISMTASYGIGGSGGGSSGSNSGGAGGSASGGTINNSGQYGSTSSSSSSGKGGNSGTVLSVSGTGGTGVSDGNNGNPGTAPGAGGSGGYKSTFGSSRPGGAGAAGRFFVRYITVTSISPASVCQGQTITITGTNFSTAAGTTVTVASVSCTNVTAVNSTTITATVPESSAGGVVAINNANGANDGITITTQTPSLAVSNTNQSKNIPGVPTVFHTNCTNLITVVNPSGASPISGNTTAKVWLETTQPANFVKRHYEITPDNNATTATGKVTLYFTQVEFDDFNAVNTIDLPTSPTDATGKANLRIEKYPGVSSDGTGLPASYTGSPVLIDPPDADIIWNSTQSRWEVGFDVTSFSGFFVKTINGTLPVTWIKVNASLNNNKQATINWKVQELNVANYSVEKSTDGISFYNIGNINSKGDGENDYSFTDANSLNGRAYYRIKQTDRDGRTALSHIMVLNTTANNSISIYPNPTADIVTISRNNMQPQFAKLSDVNGKLIMNIYLTQSQTTINLSKYANGTYLLQLQDGASIKLIKK